MASCDNGTKNDVPKNNKEQESNGKNITSEKMAREFFKEKDIELGLSKSYKSYCTIQSFKSEDVYSDDDKKMFCLLSGLSELSGLLKQVLENKSSSFTETSSSLKIGQLVVKNSRSLYSSNRVNLFTCHIVLFKDNEELVTSFDGIANGLVFTELIKTNKTDYERVKSFLKQNGFEVSDEFFKDKEGCFSSALQFRFLDKYFPEFKMLYLPKR